MYHELKCWPQYFRPLADGVKTFELRRDDRGFSLFDILRIREFVPLTGKYTGREVTRRVVYILHGPKLGLADGWLILGLGPTDDPAHYISPA